MLNSKVKNVDDHKDLIDGDVKRWSIFSAKDAEQLKETRKH